MLTRRIPLLLLGALAAVLDGAAPVRGEDAPPPTLEVRERIYDAGKVVRGETLRHAFVLRNVGKKPIAIDAKPG